MLIADAGSATVQIILVTFGAACVIAALAGAVTIAEVSIPATKGFVRGGLFVVGLVFLSFSIPSVEESLALSIVNFLVKAKAGPALLRVDLATPSPRATQTAVGATAPAPATSIIPPSPGTTQTPVGVTTPTATPTASPLHSDGTATNSTDAAMVAVVRAYYAEWNDHLFDEMWKLLSPAFRAKTSYETWLKKRTFDQSIGVTEASVTGHQQVTATVVTVNKGADGQLSSNTYHITWKLISANGSWLLDSYMQ